MKLFNLFSLSISHGQKIRKWAVKNILSIGMYRYERIFRFLTQNL